MRAVLDARYGDGPVRKVVVGDTAREVFDNALELARTFPVGVSVWCYVGSVSEKLRKLARASDLPFRTDKGLCVDPFGGPWDEKLVHALGIEQPYLEIKLR